MKFNNTQQPLNLSFQIKTLRLATSYIDYLINVLKSDDPNIGAEGFKADIHKKWNEKSEEQKKKELVRF